MTMQTYFNIGDRNSRLATRSGAWYPNLQLFLVCLACAFISPAQAQSDKVLRTLGEWIATCQLFGRDARACLITITRPEARSGHGGEPYTVPLDFPKSALMTRSGVFLSPAVSQQIAKVITDSGNRTEVLTKSGMLCSMYSYLETNFLNGSTQETLD